MSRIEVESSLESQIIQYLSTHAEWCLQLDSCLAVVMMGTSLGTRPSHAEGGSGKLAYINLYVCKFIRPSSSSACEGLVPRLDGDIPNEQD